MPTDLVLLAADKDIQHGLRGLLSRPEALGIRPISYQTYPHSQHDPACARRAHEFLRQFAVDYHHALVVFDHQGSGREECAPLVLEDEVRQKLAANGWDDRARAVVIAPELEAWVFSESPQVERCLQWSSRTPLKQWLQQRDLWHSDQAKPADPKAALRATLAFLRRPPSSAIFENLARFVSLAHCQDHAFNRLTAILREWFPVVEG